MVFSFKYLSILFIITLGLSAGFAMNPREPYPAGLLPPDDEEKEWFQENATLIAGPSKSASELPRRKINIEHLPPVDCQILGSCASWAIVYYLKGWQEAKEHGVTRPFPEEHLLSPAFVFQYVGISATTGSYISDNFDFLERHGTTTFAEFPENIYLMEGDPPSEEQWRSAAYRRSIAGSIGVIPTDTVEGLLALKEHLAGGDLAVTGVGVAENFDRYPEPAEGVHNDVFFAEGTEGFRGNHALTIIGYDDDKSYHNGTEQRQGAFLAVNSWGTGWGVPAVEGNESGYMWIAYEYFLNNEGAPEEYSFYTMQDRIGYEPRDFMVLDLKHPRRVELSLTFHVGSPENSFESMKPLINRGQRPHDARIAVDITDLNPARAEAYWLEIRDTIIPSLPARYFPYGMIREFAVDIEGRLPLGAREGLPLKTIDQLQQNPPGAQWLAATPVLMEEHRFPVDVEHSADMADVNSDGKLAIATARTVWETDGGVYTMAGTAPGNRWQSAAFGDYDNDGLADLAVYGLFEADWGIRVYRNQGNYRFEEESIFLDPSLYCTRGLHWVDYNGNGRLDLLLLNPVESRLLLNLGNGIMRESGIVFPRPPRWVSHIVDFDNDGLMDFGARRNRGDGTWAEPPWAEDAPIAWGDYDSDGLLDAAVSLFRRDDSSQSGWDYYTHIFRNEGNGGFTLVHDDLTGFESYPSQVMRWADVNNDGLLDLIISGNDHAVSRSFSTVLLQNAAGDFHESGLPLEDLGWSGPILPADFDRDGDLEWFWGGLPSDTNAGEPDSRHGRITRSYFADADGAGRPNLAPAAPDGLTAAAGSTPGTIRLQWNDSADDATPPRAMRYLLRVGTTPGGNEILSAATSLADPPHYRLAPDQAGHWLHRLPPGTFYWSVRAIDGARAFSPWAGEQSIHLSEGILSETLFDANRDRLVDASDVVATVAMIGTADTADLLVADIDGNGEIEERDADLLADYMVGRVPDTTPAWMAVVDHRGAVLENENARVTIPPNAIIGPPSVVRLEKSHAQPFGYNSDEAGPLYQLSGIPLETQLPIEIELTNPNYWWENPRVGLGREGFSASNSKVLRTYTILDPGIGEFGVLRFQLPVMDTTGLRTVQSDQEGEYSVDFLALAGYSRYTTAHFSIAFHRACDTEVVENLASDLESAWSLYQSGEVGFSYARRTNWPLDVTLRDMGAGLYGAATSSLLGDNYGTLSFNTTYMTDPAVRRVTAYHEFFHIVEAFYDPRNRFSKAKLMSPHYTLSEMAATWIEELSSSSPSTYVPSEQSTNRFAPFDPDGWDLPAGTGAGNIAAHGYGLAAAVRFLAKRSDNTVARRMFDEIRNGKNWLQAVGLASGDTTYRWFHAFNLSYLLGEIYPLTNGDVIGAASKRMRLSPSMTTQSYDEKLPNLSARLYTITLQGGEEDLITPEHRLGFRLEGPAGIRLSVASMTADRQRELVENVPWEDDVSRYLSGSIEPVFRESGSGYVALVTNGNASPRDAEDIEASLNLALLEDKTLDYPFWTGAGLFYNTAFPKFTCVGGSLMIPACSWAFPETIAPGFEIITGEIWEDSDNQLELNFPVTISDGVMEVPEINEVWQVSGINSIRVEIYEHDGNLPVLVETLAAPGGRVSFPPHAFNGIVYWQMIINYDVMISKKSTKSLINIYNMDWPIMTGFLTVK